MIAPKAARRLLPLFLLALLPTTAASQSAAEVMADFQAHYRQMVEGVENYTVVQEVMGTETTTYFVRREVDGFPIFEPQMDMGGVEIPQEGSAIDQAFFLRPDVAQRMTYEGTDDIQGHRCHVVRLDDFTGLTQFSSEQMALEAMSFCLDDDDHVVRRMQMEGTMTMQGETRPMTSVAIFDDYREISGMTHPFRVEMTMSGAMSPEQQEQMDAAMAEMEAQLERLPEAQREQMREMMESRMQGGMAAMRGEPMVIRTLDVKVNAGPPAGGM